MNFALRQNSGIISEISTAGTVVIRSPGTHSGFHLLWLMPIGLYFGKVSVGVQDWVLKDTGFISASRHGLRLDPSLRKPFDQTVIFFGSVIQNPKGKNCGRDFSCKYVDLVFLMHLKKFFAFSPILGLNEIAFAYFFTKMNLVDISTNSRLDFLK